MATHFFINLKDKNNKERYSMSKFLDFTDNFDPLTSDFLLNLSSIPSIGRFTVTGDESRPEIVSNKLFSSVQYWWILMYYNGITAVDDLTSGTQLRLPDPDALENLYFTLKSKELGQS